MPQFPRLMVPYMKERLEVDRIWKPLSTAVFDLALICCKQAITDFPQHTNLQQLEQSVLINSDCAPYKCGHSRDHLQYLMESQPKEKKEGAKEGEKPVEEQQKQEDIVGADVVEIEEGRGDYHNLVDILFVLDTTGSMGWCIKECKKTIKKIIKKFSDKQYNIKFALDTYRDHPPQEYSYVEKHYDLRSEEDIIKVLDKDCDAAGGGDTPQAVMDGLYQGLKKTSWRIGTDGTTKSKRFLFHCCDAPPHGKEYGSTSSQKTWQQKGCPCGITRLDIQGLLVQNKVDYSLIKVGSEVDMMESLFKECFAAKFKRVMPLEVKGSKKSKKMEKRIYSDEGSYQQDECQMDEPGDIRFTDCRQDECARPKALIKVDKKAKKMKMKQESASGSSSDEDEAKKEGLQRKRSMASLVCSEVESGLSDYEKELAEAEKKATK